MLKSKLSSSIDTDEYHYFFSMLSDRFIPLNERWAKGLEKRFGKPFRPIFVLPFYHNEFFEEENYLVLNEWIEQVQKDENRADIMNLIYPEDINKQFSKSSEVRALIERLKKKQEKVFVLGFTSVWLNLDDPDVIPLGPDPAVASKYDAKSAHYETFNELGLETVEVTTYAGIDALRADTLDYPIFLSAMYSSGGIESRAIYDDADRDDYYAHLRVVNKTEALIASEYIDDIENAPNSTAIVTGNDSVTVVSISDQILRANQYMGNIYPSTVAEAHIVEIRRMTEIVGRHLAKEGFRGLFGLDFLVTRSGKCYPVDLNPRRQGGYFCNALASGADLIELELAVIFNEVLPDYTYDDFQVGYSWAHSKLTPYQQNSRVRQIFNEGNPVGPFKDIGTRYAAIYYPKDYTLMVGNPGFYLVTGSDREQMNERLMAETAELIAESYEA